MSHYKQEIRFEVQKTEATEWPQKLFLLAHTRGKLSILQPITPERTFGKMNDSLFTEGITHFMLIDQQGNALSERLIFVPDHNRINGKSRQTNRLMEKEKKYLCRSLPKTMKGIR